MGLGTFVANTVAYAGAITVLLSAGNYVMDRVNPKPLSIEERKDAAGNIEHYLKYKSGDGYASLPCTNGPSGPLCGTVEYWWDSIGHETRTGLVASEWPSLDSKVKRNIVGSELDAMLENFYGSQSQKQAPVRQPDQQPNQPYKAQANQK